MSLPKPEPSILKTLTSNGRKKWILTASSPWRLTKNFCRSCFRMECRNSRQIPPLFKNYGLPALFLSRRNCFGGLGKAEGGCASPSRKLKSLNNVEFGAATCALLWQPIQLPMKAFGIVGDCWKYGSRGVLAR